MSDNNNSNIEDVRVRWFFTLVIIIVSVWAVSGWSINWYYSGDVTKRGTFGDMFGAVNALFTGAALAGIIFTILLQRKELALQRKELELNREELRRAGAAQEKTAKLTAYSALLNAHTQEAYHIQEVIEKRYASGNEELFKKFSDELAKRNEYASKLEELVHEQPPAKKNSSDDSSRFPPV
jgi:predicted transcriptional regulator